MDEICGARRYEPDRAEMDHPDRQFHEAREDKYLEASGQEASSTREIARQWPHERHRPQMDYRPCSARGFGLGFRV